MEIRPFCSKRTDQNHVKRVSCRDRRGMMSSLSLFSVIILTLSSSDPCHAAAGDISCQGIRYTYFEKGLDTTDIPAAPQQGEFLPPSNSPWAAILNPSHRHWCQSWLIITLSHSGKPPSFCHPHINHVERCFPGQRYFVRHNLVRSNYWMLFSLCVHWQWFINGRVFVIIEFPHCSHQSNESHFLLLILRLSASESGLRGYISCFVRQLNKDFLLAAQILFCRISFHSLFRLWLSQFHTILWTF